MADYLPGSDNDFRAWLENFAAYVTTNATALGLVTADTAGLAPTKTAFESALAAHVTAQGAASSAKEAKDVARRSAEGVARAIVRKLQASSSVTDAQRAAMGITVKDKTPTPGQGLTASTRPVGVVDTSQRLRHEIRFFDESTPTSRARPENAIGCEIWVRILDAGAAAPAGIDGATFLALDTASPYTAEFEPGCGGKTAHYTLRWIYRSGEKGPLSEVVSATIVG